MARSIARRVLSLAIYALAGAAALTANTVGAAGWAPLTTYDPAHRDRESDQARPGTNVWFELPVARTRNRWVRLTADVAPAAPDTGLWIRAYRDESGAWSTSPAAYCASDGDRRRCAASFWVPASATRLAVVTRGATSAQVERMTIEAATNDDGMPPADAVQRVFDLLREHYFLRDGLDWAALHAMVERVPAPPKDVDPAPAMAQLLVESLPDHKHSYVLPRSGFANGADAPVPTCEALRPGVWRAVLPLMYGTTAAARARYETALAGCVRASAADDLWLIDLRENGGGFLDPMLRALAPFFDDGPLLSYTERAEDAEPHWITRAGAQTGATTGAADADGAGARRDARMVVMIDGRCGSACEVLAAALARRARTLVVGEPTEGYLTADTLYAINAQYRIAITERYLADACGVILSERIAPELRIDKIARLAPTTVLDDREVARRLERIAARAAPPACEPTPHGAH